jgi:hypothetical protein
MIVFAYSAFMSEPKQYNSTERMAREGEGQGGGEGLLHDFLKHAADVCAVGHCRLDRRQDALIRIGLNYLAYFTVYITSQFTSYRIGLH